MLRKVKELFAQWKLAAAFRDRCVGGRKDGRNICLPAGNI